MNDLTTTNDKQVLRVHNSFIQAIFSLSVDAKKLLLTIWLHTNGNGKNIQIYRADIMEKVGIDLKNLSKEHREKIIEELMTKIITIRDIDNPNNFTKIQLVYKTKYENGILYTNIDEDLMKYIKEAKDKLFTRFNIQNIKPMTSTHAIRIYLLCKQYQDTGWLKITLDDFKKKLELEYKYPRIYDLKKYVLEVAKKQINENTDITIDYELEKKGKKYTHIIFKIKSKNKKKKVKGIKKVEIDNSFNAFRQDILSKADENQLIFLDNETYQIKNGLLYLDDKLLNKEEALEHWKFLYKNKDNLQIKSIEEIKEDNLKSLEQELNKIYKNKNTFIKIKNEYINVIIEKIEVIDFDKIKVIFKSENDKLYAVEYSSLESIKNL